MNIKTEIKQTHLFITGIKQQQRDKIQRGKIAKILQDEKFVKILLKDLKKKTDSWLKEYYNCLDNVKEWNEKCKIYQPKHVVCDPVVYCKNIVGKGIIHLRRREGFGYPEFFGEMCIEHGFLIPDDRIGFICNEKLLKEKTREGDEQ